jgi:hypothetical protein
MVWPNWANWVVDLRVVDPNRGQFWWQPNGIGNGIAVACLLLESEEAPLTYANRMFYTSGQYNVTPSGSGRQ